MQTSYTIESILDIINVSKKYRTGRKRPRESRVAYNFDIERLENCIEPLKKLNDLVGMDDIKKNIIDQILFYSQDLNTNEMMHVCITGPPGTGKTTVGKILAELYCSMGFLKTDKFKVVGRTEFIAEYLGQTAIKTKKLLTSSLNGVLFCDEVYALSSGKSDNDSYSKEAIDTINQFLSEHTENFVMIIAGYKDDVERYFFDMNPGLRRRFPWRYEVKDYTPKQLIQIFKYQVYENDWDFEDNFPFDDLECIFSQKDYFKDNGGSTLQLFDKAKIQHSRRVFGKRKRVKKYLNIQDIIQAFDLLKKIYDNTNKKSEPPYGMYI